MSLVRAVIASTSALLLTATLAAAQSTGGGPGMGSGANPPAGGGAAGSGNPATPTDLDLPLDKPEYQGAPPTPPAPPEDPPEDPRDTPPPTIYGEEIVSENDTLYYVLDISGSMDWDPLSYTGVDGTRRSGPRIDRAKAELVRSILGLSKNFKFNIVAFDCGTLQWMNALMPANDANKQAAIGWANALYPRGATGTGPACALALGDRQTQTVVLLTDGAPNCGANGLSGHRQMISANNSQGAKINVFGIAASGSYRSFCQGVASDSGGNYVDVP